MEMGENVNAYPHFRGTGSHLPFNLARTICMMGVKDWQTLSLCDCIMGGMGDANTISVSRYGTYRITLGHETVGAKTRPPTGRNQRNSIIYMSSAPQRYTVMRTVYILSTPPKTDFYNQMPHETVIHS